MSAAVSVDRTEILKPTDGAETFEQGLYNASIQDTLDYKEKQLAQSRAKGLRRLWYFIRDDLFEPVITLLRFIQLTFLFAPVIISLPIVLFGPIAPPRGERGGATLWYQYLTWTMEVAGPSFIKLGQWAASRTDIFPEGLCSQLSKLHSNAKPHSFEATRRTISNAFGMDFDEVFEEFIETPLGVGSMAQVYKAKLSPKLKEIAKSTPHEEHHEYLWQRWGEGVESITSPIRERIAEMFKHNVQEPPPSDWVVLKVLHPGVNRLVERDLRIMKFFANLLNAIPTMEWLSLPGEVEMFAHMMRLQLDLRIEADNLLIFRNNFQERRDIRFPKPYVRYSSKQVLVEEYVSGIPMSTLLKMTESGSGGALEKAISDKGLDAFLKMLLLDNFIHSDLHPGNIYVRLYKVQGRHVSPPEEVERVSDELMALNTTEEWQKELDRLYQEGFRPQVCFIDTGLVTELNKVNRRNFIDLFKAISTFDGYRVGELMIERSRTPDTALEPEIFALKVERLVHNIKKRTFALGSVRLGDLLWRVLGMVRQHHVRMEGDFITVVLSIMLLEGIGRQLDPDLDLFKSSLPILRQLGPQEKSEFLSGRDRMSMAKVWIAIEVRQFITASIQDIHNLVRYDRLCPNL
ncbi:hypothetical protein TRVA0_005S02014 [Trichomonascus vanleenenianus]|uniref:Cqd1p n=1 Tax=Trichomonascus vanleenenianus TaxID=2268995 RepID=UPI003ECAB902